MSSTNPFQKFSASRIGSSSSSSGWLTVKKRGRDDVAIERDAKAVLEQRKNARRKDNARKKQINDASSSKNKTSRVTGAQKENVKLHRAKKVKNNHSSDDDVDDDDSFIASSSDEDHIEFSGDEDDEEEEIEFESDEESNDMIGSENESNREDDDQIVDLDSSPEKMLRKKERINKPNSIIKQKTIVLDDNDSSDDDGLVSSAKDIKGTTKDTSNPRTSKFFNNEVVSPKVHIKRKTNKPHLTVFSDSDDDILDTTASKMKQNIASKKLIVRKQHSNHFDDTDEEEPMTKKERDELDEAIMLSKILYESAKENNIKSNPESETDNEGENDGVDEYIDECEKEASNVLNAANDLSSYILKVMKKWCGSSKGMIVDGALSVANLEKDDFLDEKKEDDSEVFHGWITKEEMKRCCPNIELKDYQLLGVNWLALLHRLTFNISSTTDIRKKKKKLKGGDSKNVNGVLADEMGLGKTCQAIAFLAWLKYHRTSASNRLNTNSNAKNVMVLDDSDYNEDAKMVHDGNDEHRPHLVIVPASVLTNWMREFEKFCPTMNVVKYHGSMNERQEIKNLLRAYLPKAKGPLKYSSIQKKLDAVVTTYSYFSSEKSDDRSFLRKFDWDYMVVDEAHCLKNPSGARYKNMDAFHTQRRLLLTGTPVQNSPKELMSLLCFLMPLFTREVSRFDNESSNDGGARMLEHFVRLESVEKNTEGINQDEVYKKLKQLLAPFVLRRLKEEVLSQWLPPKMRKIEWVPFDDVNKQIYDRILTEHLQRCSAGGTSESTHVFTCLRKAANHGLLLRTRFKSAEDIEHLSNALYSMGFFGRDESCTIDLVKKELASFSDYAIHCAVSTLIEENSYRKHDLGRYLLNEDDLFCSPKFCRLKEMLPHLIENGHRVLIFSQWTSILDLLECLMDAMNLRYTRLDGQTSIHERQNLIDNFTNDTSIPVFLLSTRAGGMGINLTAADVCILHDLDFNPFNDIQAEDRIHRIGQKKPVTIIKLITQGTVDADIFNMQERKTAMNAAILENRSSSDKEDDNAISAILEMAVSRFNRSSSTS